MYLDTVAREPLSLKGTVFKAGDLASVIGEVLEMNSIKPRLSCVLREGLKESQERMTVSRYDSILLNVLSHFYHLNSLFYHLNHH